MKSIITWMTAAYVTGLGGPASAAFYDGTQLANMTRDYLAIEERRSSSAEDYQTAAQFTGYVTGVTDALHGLGVLCVPVGVTVRQLGTITAKWIRDNPGEWQAPGHVIIYRAMLDPFPCAKKSSAPPR